MSHLREEQEQGGTQALMYNSSNCQQTPPWSKVFGKV